MSPRDRAKEVALLCTLFDTADQVCHDEVSSDEGQHKFRYAKCKQSDEIKASLLFCKAMFLRIVMMQSL